MATKKTLAEEKITTAKAKVAPKATKTTKTSTTKTTKKPAQPKVAKENKTKATTKKVAENKTTKTVKTTTKKTASKTAKEVAPKAVKETVTKKTTKTVAKKATKTSKPVEPKVVKPIVVETGKKMKILYAAGESLPFAATGGLADVACGLPRALAKDPSIDVRVVIPLYERISKEYRDQMQFLGSTQVNLSWRSQYCGVFTLTLEGVVYYFIDNEYYFKRPNTYGYYDDAERFAFFSKALLEMERITNFVPDILHTNDWQTALSAIYLKTSFANYPAYKNTRSMFTVHNLEYQGKYGRELLGDVFDLPSDAFSIVDYDGCINLVKGAIETCDIFSTVSPSYAQEIRTPEFAKGLHHIINQHAHKLVGIINGIDYGFYNPATDNLLVSNYDANSLENKANCKLALQKEMGLQPLKSMPLVCMVTRLVSHKGIDILQQITEEFILQNRVQFVILGSGDKVYEDYYRWLESKYPNRVKAYVGMYDNDLSRKIYAASDIFLMPSYFEPCGLSQIVASRYGAVPVVRETGGLKDTIRDFGCEGGGNGYTFKNYNKDDLLYTMNRAVQDYYQSKNWQQQVKDVLNKDFSWQNSANQYIQTYKQLI